MNMSSHGLLLQLMEASVLVRSRLTPTAGSWIQAETGNKSRSRADGVAGGLKQRSNQQLRLGVMLSMASDKMRRGRLGVPQG